MPRFESWRGYPDEACEQPEDAASQPNAEESAADAKGDIMKKSTKRMLGALVIVLIFGFSSIAFIFSSAFFLKPAEPEQHQQERFIPETYVYSERLKPSLAAQIIQAGYALAELSYSPNCCPELLAFAETLPQGFQLQLVVSLVEDETAQKPFLKATSLAGNTEGTVENNQQFLPLICKVLLNPPPDCGLIIMEQGGNK